MKLLIVTQVVDSEHPILGFFLGWIKEFAKHCDQVHVICLQEGSHDLPDNVTVHSLGKESGAGRLMYLWRFYTLIWQLRHNYDNVFVHMNQIYVILGAPFWRLWGKKIGLWYAHGAVPFGLRVAAFFSNTVFTSTEQGMRIKTPKKCIVGQGIDPNQFSDSTRSTSKLLRLITVGRISQSKNIDTLLRAAAILKQENIPFELKIIGGTSTALDVQYAKEMKSLVVELGIESDVFWVGPVSHDKLPASLNQADMFIHDGSTNSLDKTLVEAAFSGCVVISSNPSYRGLTESIAPELLFEPKDHQALANIISVQIEGLSPVVALVKKELLTTCSLPGLVFGIVRPYSL